MTNKQDQKKQEQKKQEQKRHIFHDESNKRKNNDSNLGSDSSTSSGGPRNKR